MLYNKGNVCFGGGSIKIVAKPIEMVAWTDIRGNINPIRFKITKDNESSSVVKIDKVITRTQEKFAGNLMIVFTCQSVIREVDRLYELKYEINTRKWMLFKKFRSNHANTYN